PEQPADPGYEPRLELVQPAPEAGYPSRLIGEEALFPRLPRRLFGFDRRATRAVLEQLGEEIRWLEHEWQAALAQVQAYESESARLEERERAIARSMTLGVETASRLEQEAWRESEQIIARARTEAEEIIDATRRTVGELESEAKRLDSARNRSYRELRELLLQVLDRLDSEFADPGDARAALEPTDLDAHLEAWLSAEPSDA